MLGRFFVIFFVVISPLKAQPEELRNYVLTFQNSPDLQSEISNRQSIGLSVKFSLSSSSKPYELLPDATLTGDTWKATISLTHADSPERWVSIREICIDIKADEIPNNGLLFNTRCRPLFEISATTIQQQSLIDQRTLLNIEEYYAEQEQHLLHLIKSSSHQDFRERQIEEKIRIFFQDIPESLIGHSQLDLYTRMIRFANSNQIQLDWTDYYTLKDRNGIGPIGKISRSINSDPSLAKPLLEEYLLVDFDKQATTLDSQWALNLLDSISYLTFQSIYSDEGKKDASDLLDLAKYCENYEIKNTMADLTKFKYTCVGHIKKIIQEFYDNTEELLPEDVLTNVYETLQYASRLANQRSPGGNTGEACRLVKNWRLNNKQINSECD